MNMSWAATETLAKMNKDNHCAYVNLRLSEGSNAKNKCKLTMKMFLSKSHIF
jgi:hypothetical protein